jgi:hypothetical protein
MKGVYMKYKEALDNNNWLDGVPYSICDTEHIIWLDYGYDLHNHNKRYFIVSYWLDEEYKDYMGHIFFNLG